MSSEDKDKGSGDANQSDKPSREEEQASAPGDVPPKEKRYKTTPLPMRQMVPMAIVLLNESLCQTMIMPFIGYLIAYLQDTSVNDAGYYSGLIIGVFMLGQVLSASKWGQISDTYGRRFPLISGLFTSGLMMLFFGLSGNVWLCSLFRFLHGVFNGNILVAKTMMADITDKTNQARGFAFVAFCGAMGTLVGPITGGLLYDPSSDESALSFLGFSKTGIFARRPALLASLFIFFYTNVGMLVCTFFVQESNPKAKPLPEFIKFIYPCFLVPAKPFVATPMVEITDDEEGGEAGETTVPCAVSTPACVKSEAPSSQVVFPSNHSNTGSALLNAEDGSTCCRAEDRETEIAPGDGDEHVMDKHDANTQAQLFACESNTFPVGAIGMYSPVVYEDVRSFDKLVEERLSTRALAQSRQSMSSLSALSSSRNLDRSLTGVDDDSTHSSGSSRRGSARRPDRRAAGCDESDAAVALRRTEVPSTAAAVSALGDAPIPRRRSRRQTPALSRSSSSLGSGRQGRDAPQLEEDEDDIHATADQEKESELLGTVSLRVHEGGVGKRSKGDSVEDEHVSDDAGSATAPAEGEPPAERKHRLGYREAFSRPITRFMLVTYMIMCASDITVKQCIPLWAISSESRGGLDLTPSQVSYIFLINGVPALASNYFFAKACARYNNKIGLFRVGVTFAGLAAICIPLTSYLPYRALQYVIVVLFTSSQQFFASWCYGLITMLTARAAPPGQVGAIMGINQSCGATSRGIVPVITSRIFAWSIKVDRPFPINHCFVFLLSGLSFTFCWFRSYSIMTSSGTDLSLVEGDEKYGPRCLRRAIGYVRRACGCAETDEATRSTDVVITDA